LARGAIWNVAGQAVPLLVAVFSIPPLIGLLGLERFGLLTLVWALIGYFSLLDLGLGRAVTKLVAQRLAENRESETGEIVVTSLVLMCVLGLLGSAAVVIAAPSLATAAFETPLEFQAEVLIACYVLALTIPFVSTGAALLGYLAAINRFDLINRIRIPIGILNYLAPLGVAMVVPDLGAVVAVVALTRVLSWLAYAALCRKDMKARAVSLRYGARHVRALFGFGAWITVSNLISPIMVFADRFVLAALLPAAGVAYYTTPYEVVSRLWIIPSALVAVLFPAFAFAHASSSGQVPDLYARSAKAVGIVMYPIILVLVAFSKEILDLWLGAAFSEASFRVLQLLASGVFLNSLAQLPSTLVQSVGRPDITAKLHLWELPVYLLVLVSITRSFGLVGAACVWVSRMVADGIALALYAGRLVPGTRATPKTYLAITAALCTFALVANVSSVEWRFVACAAFLSAFAVLTWRWLLSPGDRSAFATLFGLGDSK
jgi:O-antigen/teichoic acid export membrane protein